jgi:hypothetical protein
VAQKTAKMLICRDRRRLDHITVWATQDPFSGSGTTGQVAEELGRDAVLIELNPIYLEMQGIRRAVEGVLEPSPKPHQNDEDSAWLF